MQEYYPINTQDTKKEYSGINAFFATVETVFLDIKDFTNTTKKDSHIDSNKNLIKDDSGNEKNITQLGSIYWRSDDSQTNKDYAYPFDKNNITYPIEGETVIIIQIDKIHFWLPYGESTIFPNYKQSRTIFKKSQKINRENSDTTVKSTTFGSVQNTGTPFTDKSSKKTSNPNSVYKKNENIKYLKPLKGDTFVSGRAGNTIRLSQFWKNEEEITPSIIISNGQSNEVLNKPIGFLAEESINNDGSSIYITSGKSIVEYDFKKTKENTSAWGTLPTAKNLNGNQIYLNSDRVILSSKQSDFIIFGKGHTGVITGDRYTIDAAKDIHIHSDDSIKIQSAGKDVRILTDTGKIYIGNTNSQNSDTPLKQPMVKGDDLVKILSEVLEELAKQVFATGAGPTGTGPANAAAFRFIKSKLNTILSQTNFLS